MSDAADVKPKKAARCGFVFDVLAKDAAFHFNLRKHFASRSPRADEAHDLSRDREVHEANGIAGVIRRSAHSSASPTEWTTSMCSNMDASCACLSSLLFATSSMTIHSNPKFMNSVSDRHCGYRSCAHRTATVKLLRSAWITPVTSRNLLDVQTADKLACGWMYSPSVCDATIMGFPRRVHDLTCGMDVASFAHASTVHVDFERGAKRNAQVMSVVCRDWRVRGIPEQHGPEYVHSWRPDKHRPAWLKHARDMFGLSDAQGASALMMPILCEHVGTVQLCTPSRVVAMLCDVDVLCQMPAIRSVLDAMFTTAGGPGAGGIDAEEIKSRCFVGTRSKACECAKGRGRKCACNQVYAFESYVRALPWGCVCPVLDETLGQMVLPREFFEGEDGGRRDPVQVTSLCILPRADLLMLCTLCVTAGVDGMCIGACAVEKVPGVVRMLVRFDLKTLALDVALRFAASVSEIQTGVVAASGACRHPAIASSRKCVSAVQQYMRDEYNISVVALGLGVAIGALVCLRATLGPCTLPPATQVAPYAFTTPVAVLPFISDGRVDAALRAAVWQAYAEFVSTRHVLRVIPCHPDAQDEAFSKAHEYFAERCSESAARTREPAGRAGVAVAIDYACDAGVTRLQMLCTSQPEYAREVHASCVQRHSTEQPKHEGTARDRACSEGAWDGLYFVPSTGPLLSSDSRYSIRYARRRRLLIADAISNVKGTTVRLGDGRIDMTQSQPRCLFNVMSLSPMKSLWMNASTQADEHPRAYIASRNALTQIVTPSVNEFAQNILWTCGMQDVEEWERELVRFTPYDVVDVLQLPGVVIFGSSVWKSVYVPRVAERCLDPCAHVDVLCCGRDIDDMTRAARALVSKVVDMSGGNCVAVLHGRARASVVVISPLMSCAMVIRFARGTYSVGGDATCSEDYGIPEASAAAELDPDVDSCAGAGGVKAAVRAALAYSKVQYEQMVYVSRGKYSTVHATPCAIQNLRSGVTFVSLQTSDMECGHHQGHLHAYTTMKRVHDGFMVCVGQGGGLPSRVCMRASAVDDISMADTGAETSSPMRLKAALCTNSNLMRCVKNVRKYLFECRGALRDDRVDSPAADDALFAMKRRVSDLCCRDVTILCQVDGDADGDGDKEDTNPSIARCCMSLEHAAFWTRLDNMRVFAPSAIGKNPVHAFQAPPYGGLEMPVAEVDVRTSFACLLECPGVDHTTSVTSSDGGDTDDSGTHVLLYDPASGKKMGHITRLHANRPVALVPEFGTPIFDIFTACPGFGVVYTAAPWAFVAKCKVDGVPNRDATFAGGDSTHVAVRVDQVLCRRGEEDLIWCSDPRALNALRDLIDTAGVDVDAHVADTDLWEAVRCVTGSKDERGFAERAERRFTPVFVLPNMLSAILSATPGTHHSEYMSLLEAKEMAAAFSASHCAHMDGTGYRTCAPHRHEARADDDGRTSPTDSSGAQTTGVHLRGESDVDSKINFKFMCTQSIDPTTGRFVLHTLTFRSVFLAEGNEYAANIRPGDEVLAMVSFAGVVFGHPADIMTQASRMGMLPALSSIRSGTSEPPSSSLPSSAAPSSPAPATAGVFESGDAGTSREARRPDSLCLFALWEIRCVARIHAV